MGRRSILFAPGDQPEIMRKAVRSEADVVVFDLEDAVVPSNKQTARKAVQNVLDDVKADGRICVRVNPIEYGASTDLTTVLSGTHPDSVMLPKTESANDVTRLTRLLAEEDADLPVQALIESASGVLRADEIAAAPGTDALLFGAEDLTADIGATRTSEGTEVLYARERVVLAASAADVDAIDTVYTDFGDADGLREETEFAIELGYDGKMAIHPDQVSIINDAFTPDQSDIEWAERVLAADEQTESGVYEVDGEMIDAPLIKRAERILERASEATNRDA
ncbi:HpcH/HpaI aldolase/citrate lyase family protein [Halorientalis salina]|uniref:HpcH/HpaI aldolase/citrate lyase family protein n=1 Tax=Halorientalis salina TaxID=2932266 RepID=UPI0010AD7C44|nr:CoA ester lyase [Halorientalis salina]